MLAFNTNYNLVTVRRLIEVEAMTSRTGASIYAAVDGGYADVYFGVKDGEPCGQHLRPEDCNDLVEFFTRLAEELRKQE